jgi:hypothetical protein
MSKVWSRWLRSSFVWPLAIVCLGIPCWAVTPLSTLAKPRQHVVSSLVARH